MARISKLAAMTAGAVALAVVAAVAAVGIGKGSASASAPELQQPSQSELETFAGSTVLFGHQSVGSNILDGVTATYAASGQARPRIIDTRSTVPGDAAYLAHTHVGQNGDPFGKFEDFSGVVNGPLGAEVEVALVKLCYTDVIASTDPHAVFDAYATTMTELENRHPDVRFLYTTVPLTTDRGWKADVKALLGRDDHMGPADNRTRHEYNELVRARYGDSGRLLDVAAVEATLTQDPMHRDLDGQPYDVLNSALSADAGHLNEQGARAVAAELVRVVVASDSVR